MGQLVVFEKYSGKSYRGECGCSPGYNQNYWPDTGMCYEWYTRGPCKESFLFQYDKSAGRTECVCDEQEGFVFWNETEKCYRVYTQGPCPANAWLIPGDGDSGGPLDDVFCECVNGYRFDPETYTCVKTGHGGLSSSLPHHGGGRDPWVSLLEKLRRAQPRRMANAGADPIEWSRGVFVTPGHTGIDRRTFEGPDYAWKSADGEGGWGAQALPRRGRSWRRRKRRKTSSSSS